IAGAKEATLADGHRIVDVDAAIVFGPLRRDNRGACGAYAVFQGFAVRAPRTIANIRRLVCHGFRTRAIPFRPTSGPSAINQFPTTNTNLPDLPHNTPPQH